MGVEFAVFLKIEARLKALYVRFWGIPEGEKTMGTVFFCPPAFSARQKVKPVPIVF